MRLGYDRIWRDNKVVDLLHLPADDATATLAVLADRVDLGKNQRKRVIDSIEAAQRFGNGRVEVCIDGREPLAFSSRLHCAHCDVEYSPPLGIWPGD